jgi:hypothetical protein
MMQKVFPIGCGPLIETISCRGVMSLHTEGAGRQGLISSLVTRQAVEWLTIFTQRHSPLKPIISHIPYSTQTQNHNGR